ncbi:MAG: response regulator [Desulfosalsimonadaceae bacterium]|nr:response regulator [Desulfosalsimonadaceae bacterium]
MEKNKINLLFVDDEDQFLTSMSKRLEARGFHVLAVNRGEKAVETARTHPVDIALVDLKMPGMNGEETLKALKQEHAWMEIVILTGHGSIDSAVECTQSGAHSYLQKPCDLDQILEVLKEAYKKRVMNRRRIGETQMAELLQGVKPGSPREILRRLKEIDERKQ